jgi:hypothetical protein
MRQRRNFGNKNDESMQTVRIIVADHNYLVIASQTSGTTRNATTDFTVTGITVGSPSQIAVQVITKSSKSSTAQKVYLYNYSTSVWDQKDSTTISTPVKSRGTYR